MVTFYFKMLLFIRRGEEVEVNDFVGLLALVKFYDSEEGKKIRNDS